jgi:uncharacterized protein (DUF58 family)
MKAVWIIIIVGLLALGQAAYYGKRGLYKVSYTRRFSRERVFAGEKVELVEVLANGKPLPVPWVRVESRIASSLRFKRQENLGIAMDRFHKSLFYLGPYSKITRRHEITCLDRGYYDCSLVSVVAGDLIDLAHDRRDVVGNARLYVYPAVIRPDELPDYALKWQGEVSVRRWILPDPILINGIREYRYGDLQRDVHWIATAKTGRLQVKMRDYTVSPRTLLILNCQISETLFSAMEPAQTAFIENGVSICASLAAWCVENGIDVGFMTNGANRLDEGADIRLEPRCSAAQLEKILETLALLNIKMRLAMHTLLDRQIAAGLSDMDIVIVSAYWSEALELRASRLRRMNNSVTHMPIRQVLGKRAPAKEGNSVENQA